MNNCYHLGTHAVERSNATTWILHKRRIVFKFTKLYKISQICRRVRKDFFQQCYTNVNDAIKKKKSQWFHFNNNFVVWPFFFLMWINPDNVFFQRSCWTALLHDEYPRENTALPLLIKIIDDSLTGDRIRDRNSSGSLDDRRSYPTKVRMMFS